jgi:hypothetical protein
MVAWLPREGMKGAPQDLLPVGETQLDPGMFDLNKTNIRDLRDAIRANWVSFPSQVPTFPKEDRPDLQRKLAQLYFVLGWNVGAIGLRYGLTPQRVRKILGAWKHAAVKALYVQSLPAAKIMSCQIVVSQLPHPVMTITPGIIPQLVHGAA